MSDGVKGELEAVVCDPLNFRDEVVRIFGVVNCGICADFAQKLDAKD